MPFMEIDESSADSCCWSSHSQSSSECKSSGNEFSRDELLDNEIWDEVLDNEVDEDTLEGRNIPFVAVDEQQVPSHRTLLNCLVILLGFFWTYFPIPNNAMEFLLISLKQF